jgi:hypothetical protein
VGMNIGGKNFNPALEMVAIIVVFRFLPCVSFICRLWLQNFRLRSPRRSRLENLRKKVI